MDESREQAKEEAWNLAQIKQRRSRLNAKPIGSVVRRLMAQSGYGQTQGFSQLAENWSNAVGPTLSKVTRPGVVSRGILNVHVANSAAMQELYFQKRKIVAVLAKKMPEAGVTDIKARVGPID